LVPRVRQAIISEKALKDQFEKFIFGSLTKLSQVPLQSQRLIVVIDALDECDREDIRTILTLLAWATDIRPVLLRIVLTSRLELPIRLGFKDMAEGAYQDLILHEVPPAK
jgi:hypothetical protein